MTETYTEPVNPVEIERSIRHTADLIAKGVRVLDDADRAVTGAQAALDRAYAKAFLTHDGPQTEKKYAAELATETERDAHDLAGLQYRHALRVARALDKQLDAYRSIGVSVRSMYGSTA